MTLFNTMLRISCISIIAIIAIFKNFIVLNASADREFLAVTIATDQNDALNRYKQSAESFNIPYEIYGQGLEWKGGDMANKPGGGQKVRILREKLEKYKDKNDMIIMFTDAYDVVFQNTSDVIMQRFREMNVKVLFSAEGFCWPDKSLADKYPVTSKEEYRFLNSGGFIGYAPYIYKIVSTKKISNSDDDQLYYTNIFLDENLRKEYDMKLDTKAEIFQNLHGAFGEVFLTHNGKLGYFRNVVTDSTPAVIHGNGPIKNDFNGFTNYLGYSYSPSAKCQHCKIDNIDLESKQHTEFPTVTMALVVNIPTPFLSEFFERISNLSYPKERMDLVVFCSEPHHLKECLSFTTHASQRFNYKSVKLVSDNSSEIALRNNIIKLAKTFKNDFVFSVDSIVQIKNTDTLQILVTKNRTMITPMFSRREKLWSNFWGALNSNGYYQRSEDYIEIVQNVKRGIWNVPFVSDVYLMKGSMVANLPDNMFGLEDTNGEADMNFCANLRKKLIFMWVDNEFDYGHLTFADRHTTKHLHNDLWEIFDNPIDWEEKYIHSEYRKAADTDATLEEISQPCPDVFWFPLVSRKFCNQIVEEMEAFGEWSDGTNTDSRLEGGYENVPTRDIHMRQVDWEEHWLHVLKTYIYPMQKKLFAGYDDVPTARMNFVVRYRPDEQPTLRPHHDASSYSLNIALNRPGIDFQGGGTLFNRYKCPVNNSHLGWVLMHPGRVTHLHEGLRTTNGTRYIFVTFVNP